MRLARHCVPRNDKSNFLLKSPTFIIEIEVTLVQQSQKEVPNKSKSKAI
jgi:hypothetical protein